MSVNPSTLQKVEAVLIQSSKGSWELGTLAQAVLEYQSPLLTPFDPSYNPSSLHSIPAESLHPQIPLIAKTVYDHRPSEADLPWGRGKVLWNGGAVGDLGSLIPTMLIGAGVEGNGRREEYGGAVRDQVDWMLNDALTTSDGALSHRMEHLELWADFVYMTPPSVALYGLHHPDGPSKALLTWSYTQCKLQRSHFLNSDTGLWKHIVYGDTKKDPYCWSTSNAWAAAGMLRVLVTIERSPFASEMSVERADLLAWVREIMDAVVERTTFRGMVHNYVDESSTFEESCGTVLFAFVAYRLAQLNMTSAYIPFAGKARGTLWGEMIDPTTGVLRAVSDIDDERKEGGRAVSPEGQAFVLLMEAAYRDWKGNDGIKAA